MSSCGGNGVRTEDVHLPFSLYHACASAKLSNFLCLLSGCSPTWALVFSISCKYRPCTPLPPRRTITFCVADSKCQHLRGLMCVLILVTQVCLITSKNPAVMAAKPRAKPTCTNVSPGPEFKTAPGAPCTRKVPRVWHIFK